MNLFRRMVTTSRPTITRSIWSEVRTQYLHDIVHSVVTYIIPDKIIINVDQTPSKYDPTENIILRLWQRKIRCTLHVKKPLIKQK